MESVEDREVFNSLCVGACGYLLKDVLPARLLEAIRELPAGGAPMSPEVAHRVVTMFQRFAPAKLDEPQLSARERDVLQLLAEGHSYKTCADRLSVKLCRPCGADIRVDEKGASGERM